MNKANHNFIVLSKAVVNNHALSAEALAVICYVLSRWGHECKIAKYEVIARFGWGNHTWYRVSRELKKLGYLNEVIGNKGTQLYFNIGNPLDSSDYLDSYVASLRSNGEVEDGQL